MITKEQQDQLDNWDPEEAREKMSARGVKMPVTLKRDDIDEPVMDMEVSEPKGKVITITKKPTIINLGKPKKNALF